MVDPALEDKLVEEGQYFGAGALNVEVNNDNVRRCATAMADSENVVCTIRCTHLRLIRGDWVGFWKPVSHAMAVDLFTSADVDSSGEIVRSELARNHRATFGSECLYRVHSPARQI